MATLPQSRDQPFPASKRPSMTRPSSKSPPPDQKPTPDEVRWVRKRLAIWFASGIALAVLGAGFTILVQSLAASVAFILSYIALVAAFATPAKMVVRFRQPLASVFSVAFAIAVGVLAILGAGSARGVLQFLGASSYAYPYVFAPIVEEALKPVGVAIIAYNLRRLPGKAPILPLLAGALWAGYLFGLAETWNSPEYSASLVPRLLSSIPGHADWTFLVGLGIAFGLLRLSNQMWPGILVIVGSYALAVLLHSAWNMPWFPVYLRIWPFFVWIALVLATGFLLFSRRKKQMAPGKPTP